MLHGKQLAVLIFCAILGGLLIGYAFVLIRKVCNLVKWTDLAMLFSIISITLALTFMLIFIIWSIIGTVTPITDFFNSNLSDCIANGFDCLKLTFIFHAFIYDLYKWCIFLVATSTDISQNKEVNNQRQNRLKVILFATLALVLLINIIMTVGVLANTQEED
jgi:hypothetical protein